MVRAASEGSSLAPARFRCYLLYMGKSIKKVTPKKRGRPATGKDPVSTLRLSNELKASIDQWRDAQPGKPSRSAAIRMLVEMALVSQEAATPVISSKIADDLGGFA